MLGKVRLVEAAHGVILVDLGWFFVGLRGLQVLCGGCEGVFGGRLFLHQVHSSVPLG